MKPDVVSPSGGLLPKRLDLLLLIALRLDNKLFASFVEGLARSFAGCDLRIHTSGERKG